jgi:integrase
MATTMKKGRRAKVQALAAISPRTARLTDAAIKWLPLPAAGNVITWDDDVAGFGCRVTAAGARSFVFNYRVKGSGQQRRVTIGTVGDWSTGPARNEARRLRRLVDNGADPRGDHEESRDAPTMAELIGKFESEYLPRKRESTIRSYKGMLDKHIKPHFGRFTKAADVEFEDIDKLHREVTATGSRYVANRCVSLLSRIFSLAIRWKMRSDNPCKGIERNAEQKRIRYLSGDELARLTKALTETDDKQFVNVVMTLVLTGARRGEVFSMRWDALHLAKGKAVWSKPGSETKQKRDHTIALSEPVRLLLASIERDGDFVFPSNGATGHLIEIKKAWKALLDRAGIKSLRIHDLRHSFASQLVNSGASLALIGSMLGHASPVTTSRYAHLYDETQREAAERVGKIVGEANGSGDGGSHG